ncbi:MAG TPA: CoA transferase [Caulobacteraceae bacterium]|nr:CoA transferase [Caulobacteraceae bacterium]
MTITRTAFDGLMRLYGRERPEFVSFDEGTPALPTRFVADEAAAAALAAGATVAADLWRLRSGEGQQVRVATREAAAGLGSFTWQRFADPAQAPPARGADPYMQTAAHGFKATGDGRHVFLHPSFPPGVSRVLKALDCEDSPEAVAAACAARTAQDIEDAVAAERGCAAMVRTPEEWDASEQGRALAARPVVEVIKIGESAPEPLPAGGEAALSGVRVLDLTRVLAGPTCARTLAQYGADVLYLASPHLPAAQAFVADTNHGKLSAWLELDSEGGGEILAELVRGADVFSQGYRTGSLERQGFGPLELARLRPGLVYVSINCYGHEGPWRGRAGWEQLAQTVTGMAHVHGGEEGPRLQPAAVTDYTTGFLAAFGALVALHHRALWGGSYLVRVSLCQTGMWIRGLGIEGPERLARVEPLTEDEVAGWSVTSQTGFGEMRHLRPAVTMDSTPARWTRPVVRLGTHPAAWPR